MSMAAFPDRPGRQPLRFVKPARRTGRRRPAAAPSRASLVADFLVVCELDAAVETLQAPAEPAVFDLGGTLVEHVADFELVRDGAPTLVDVVTEADLVRHPLRAALVGGAVAVDGRAFAFETAATVLAEPRFTTVRLIQACRRTPVTAGDRVRILHQLDECGTMRLVDCAGAAQNAADGVAAVLALAVEGLIEVDISRPLLPETPVRRRKLAYSDPFGF
jgi:hypothetical protein